MDELVIFVLVILAIIAALTRQTYVLVIAYFLAGSYLIGRWWPRHSMKNLMVERSFVDHVFPGETVHIAINLHNKSWLPAIWLSVRDLHPIDLSELRAFRHVVTLLSRTTIHLAYDLRANKRGYYPVGPMTLETGDLFGWTDQLHSGVPADFLTVYPKVIPLKNPNLPSSAPLGTLRHRQPIFEDPTRPVGKREYRRGDALRRVDWKSTASSGRLQVKIFEPSIDLETAIFLNLSTDEYHPKSRFDGPELAIVAAASLANWAITNRQPVGLVTNGFDLLNQTGSIQPLAPRKGRPHLMRLLETLARIKGSATPLMNCADMINHYQQDFSWGTTVIVVTGSADFTLLQELRKIQKVGLRPFLVICGWFIDLVVPLKNGKIFGIPARILHKEDDLRNW